MKDIEAIQVSGCIKLFWTMRLQMARFYWSLMVWTKFQRDERELLR